MNKHYQQRFYGVASGWALFLALVHLKMGSPKTLVDLFFAAFFFFAF